MNRVSDPTYALFQADAERQGFETLADYFRHYGITPPANWGRPAHKSREIAQHDSLDRLYSQRTWIEGYAIDKSWGEPGSPYRVSAAAGAEA